MDSSVAEPSERNDIELGPVTHWPTVYAAIGVGAVVCVGLVAVAALAAPQPASPPEAPEAVAAFTPAPPPRPRGLAMKTVATAPPLSVVVTEPDPEPPAQPLPPAPPPVPVRVATAVTPIIRVSDSAPVPEPPPAAPEPPPEFALFEDLQAHAHQIDLDAVPGTAAKLLGKIPETRDKTESPRRPSETIRQVIARRPDLAGLPMRGEAVCKAPEEMARAIERVSQPLRGLQAGLPPCDAPLHYDRAYAADPQSFDDTRYRMPDRNNAILRYLDDKTKKPSADCASILAQMLQAEDRPVRLQLTEMLAGIKGRPAGQALARLALFDLTAEVREAAVAALKDRPAEEYRQVLLDGFRHPWPPVADHAAAALTALEDRGAVKALQAMLDLPDPAAPRLDENKKWVKAEVVKVNHLRNCLLCHSPSSSPKDPIRGFVPQAGVKLPPAYYAERAGDFVRADVTYLRQDFSLVEAVGEHDPWPLGQRFDYFVRSRELTEQELIDMVGSDTDPSQSYPQRASVLLAIEKLTNPGDASPIQKVGLGP